MSNNAGVHITADLWGCSQPDADNRALAICRKAAKAANLKVLATSQHRFQPFGYTCLLLLSTSHVSFHSWQENDLICVDIFSCSSESEVEEALQVFLDELKPTSHAVHLQARGAR